jgi:hypothetical protein
MMDSHAGGKFNLAQLDTTAIFSLSSAEWRRGPG